jgi:hypothetical protein
MTVDWWDERNGEPALPRPVLRRVPGEWEDAIEDALVEDGFTWLTLPCSLAKETAVRPRVHGRPADNGDAARVLVRAARRG